MRPVISDAFVSRPMVMALALCFGVPAHANKEVTLPVIQIFGSQNLLEYTPGSGAVIEEEDLEKTPPLSTQDALRRLPGIHAVETEGYGFYPRITIRGLGSDMSKKVLLLEDGAPIALGPFTDPAAYYSPPIERMERIEVLKGSGALRFGPSTIGGAINYITRSPASTPGGRVRLSAGNQDYTNMLAEYGGSWDNVMGSISLLRKKGDGWRNMPFDVRDVVLKGGIALNDRNFLGIKLTHHEMDAQHTYRGLTAREYRENYKQNAAVNDKMFIKRNSIDVNHELDFGDGAMLKTLFYWNNAVRDWWRENYSFNAGTGLNNSAGLNNGRLREFTVMGVDSRFSTPHQAFGVANHLEVGVRYHREEMENQRVEGFAGRPGVYKRDPSRNNANVVNGVREQDTRKADSIALFVENRFHVTDAFTVTPGVRVERYTQRRDIDIFRTANNVFTVDSSSKVTNTEVVPGIGANWQVTPVTTVFAGVHKGFAPPRVQDAISNEGSAVNLDAERSVNYEIGVRGQWNKGNYEATLFRLDFKNQLVQQAQAGGVGTMNTNAGKTLNQGIELSGDWYIGNGFTLAGNYTWLDKAELKSTRIIGGVDRNGNRLTYAPEHLLNLRLEYSSGRFSTNVGASYISQQFADLENTRSESADGRRGILPSYTIWDLNAQYELQDGVRVFASVRNLFDRKYIASRAPEGIFPGMERFGELGLEVKF